MAQKNSKKFSFIGENIKKIRQAKNISQAEFSSIFNLARPSIGAYEEGRSEPKVDTIIQIANYFRISIDVLLTRQLTVSEIYSMGMLKQKLDKAHQLTKEASASVGTSGTPLIKVETYLEYIVNVRTVGFVNSLPKIIVPIAQPEKHRAIEMNGSEMEYHQQGLHHGDLLIAEQTRIEDIEKNLQKALCIVHKGGITTRRLDAVEQQSIHLKADDPNYPSLSIDKADILEVWKPKSVYSTYLNPPTLLEERVLKLEKSLEELKRKRQ